MWILVTLLLLNVWTVPAEDVFLPNINILEELQKIKTMEARMKSMDIEIKQLKMENEEKAKDLKILYDMTTEAKINMDQLMKQNQGVPVSHSLKAEIQQVKDKIARIEKVLSYSTFRKVDQKYYIFDRYEAVFDNGMQYCKDIGGTIVLPKTAEENKALLNVLLSSGLKGKKPFIRATDRETEGRFVDTDGNPLTFTNWAPGQPDDYKEQDCGSIMESGLWDDVGCYILRPIICEIEIM